MHGLTRQILPFLLGLLVAAPLALAPRASAQDSGLLEKRKEGKYFLELGEVFLRSDEFEFIPGFVDPDGVNGPAGFQPVKVPTGDTFSTDPRVTLGLNRPDGKTTIAFTAWQFNAEDFLRETTDAATQTFENTFELPGLLFTRQGGINVPQNVTVNHGRDLKYFHGSWERNLHESKLHRTRLLLGLKFIQFQEGMDVTYEYGDEFLRILNEVRKFNDRQQISSRITSQRLGPSLGIESQFKLGKKFRLTSRAELLVGDESIVVQYRNRAAEISPSITQIAGGQVIGSTGVDAPIGVHDRELLDQFGGLQGFGGLDLKLFGDNERKVTYSGEISIRGAWDLNQWVQAGAEYKWIGLYDVPSAQLAAEAVRDTISKIDVDVIGLETQAEPDDDAIVYNFDVGDIVVRHDVVFDGAHFFLRFNF